MLEHWLRLNYLRGFSLSQKRLLVKRLGSPKAVINSPVKQLCSLLDSSGFNMKQSNPSGMVVSGAVNLAVQKDLELLENRGASFIPFTDPAYPPLLNQIHSAPLGLFFQGDLNLLDHPKIAIVGSRRATRSGKQTAYRFAQDIANSGITVTSGLALGIDSYAHRGALHSAGNTIGVIATGIDRVYPAGNKKLHLQIAETGLLLSEFMPGTPPKRSNFPQRNRIISGLCLGTIVVEAGIRSGSLITARLAADQGREVFAVPGPIHAPGSRGCHYLLRQGAALIESVEDVLDELRWGGARPPISDPSRDPDVDGLGPDEQRIFALIEHSPCPIDQLISLSGLTTEQVSSILVRLELQGLVSESIGGYQKLPGAPAPKNT